MLLSNWYVVIINYNISISIYDIFIILSIFVLAYELASDNKTCYLPDAFLLYAQKENISKASLENRNIDLVIPVKGVREAK